MRAISTRQSRTPTAPLSLTSIRSRTSSSSVATPATTPPKSSMPAPLMSAPAALASLSLESESTSRMAASMAAPLAALATSWVHESSDVGAFKAVFDGTTGGSGSTLSLSGSAAAFGTFDGDPFGLGKGVILSTGRVEDLPGENTVESGGSNVTSIPISFVKIGRAGGSDIFRADLSNLGVDIRSLKISDANTHSG